MPYIKSICRAGKTKEIAKYYTRRFHSKGEKRNRKEKVTSKQQQKINDRQLVRKLTYILNENFEQVCYIFIQERKPALYRANEKSQEGTLEENEKSI